MCGLLFAPWVGSCRHYVDNFKAKMLSPTVGIQLALPGND